MTKIFDIGIQFLHPDAKLLPYKVVDKVAKIKCISRKDSNFNL